MSSLKKKIFTVIFGTNTPSGKLFDVILLWAIVLSVLAVMLESVHQIDERFHTELRIIEWVFTVLFTVEYFSRIWVSPKPLKYVTSFLGVIDLLAILPTYLSVIFSGGTFMVVIRAVRLLRVFRILKLTRYISEASVLGEAVLASSRKIIVFMGAVFTLVIITGTLMYMIEGGENGFTSIPRGIYWAVVTITTVGYGDISPQTVLGQGFATLLMLVGYAIIAVPTGIVTSELSRSNYKKMTYTCPHCRMGEQPSQAKYCYNCGKEISSKKDFSG